MNCLSHFIFLSHGITVVVSNNVVPHFLILNFIANLEQLKEGFVLMSHFSIRQLTCTDRRLMTFQEPKNNTVSEILCSKFKRMYIVHVFYWTMNVFILFRM